MRSFFSLPILFSKQDRFHLLLPLICLSLAIGNGGCDSDESNRSFSFPVNPSEPSDSPSDQNDGSSSLLPPSESDNTPSSPTPSDLDQSPHHPNLQQGRDLYLQWCASCHGNEAQGVSAPPLYAWDQGRDPLIETTTQRMPLSNPELCDEECSTLIADYLLSLSPDSRLTCLSETQPALLPAPRLRLLTRREYERTLHDLFQTRSSRLSQNMCSTTLDCTLDQESCVDAQCTSDACSTHTFILYGYGNYQRVHVAGSFNQWSAQYQDGLSLQHNREGDFWWAKLENLNSGEYQYKFVLDESEWIMDPDNPLQVSDGFSGQNSVFEISCSSSNLDQGNTALSSLIPTQIRDSLPAEIRPEHYLYETHFDGQVTTRHLEAYLDHAQRIASAVDFNSLLDCNAENADEDCLRRFIQDFGLRVFRRPLDLEERERFLTLVLAQESPTLGLQVALRVMLSSPSFLYRSEIGEPTSDPNLYQLTDFEIASALSYLIWGSMPDHELLSLAQRGELNTPEQVYTQAQRLLTDPRAQEQTALFARQWLGIERVITADKTPFLFPDYDEALRRSLLSETERFFNWIVFEGEGNYEALFLTPSTFMNERLSQYYQSTLTPSDFSSSSTPWLWTPTTQNRVGLLGHGSILSATSHSDQTSPIKRGLFVRQNLLCQSFPEPPPDAGGVPEVDPNATTRERFRQHTENEVCASCHQYIDDLGFGFEQYDAIGQWRSEENGLPIDHQGNLNDLEGLGSDTDAPFHTLEELAHLLVNSNSAPNCMATRYFEFARGEAKGSQNRCEIEALQSAFTYADYQIQDLILEYTQLKGFTLRSLISSSSNGSGSDEVDSNSQQAGGE